MTEHTPSPTLSPAKVPTQSAPVACATCGAAAPGDPPPLTWSAGIERGRRIWSCEGCMRENIRSIEAKLDTTWW